MSATAVGVAAGRPGARRSPAAARPAVAEVPARARRLLVLGPARLAAAAAERLVGKGREAAADALPDPDGRPADPYGLGELLARRRSECDAVLVIAPRRRGPRRIAPGPVVGGVAIAIVQADRPAELAPWLGAVDGLGDAPAPAPAGGPPPGTAQVAVCAMGKAVYLEIAGGWVEALRAGALATSDLRADRTRREALCAALAAGPPLVLYAGHGRARGWSGYQALRWPNIEAEPLARPTGAVLAFACDTLVRTRGLVPFGARFIAGGRAAAYLGAAGRVTIAEGRLLGDRMVAELASGRHRDLAALLAAVARAGDPALARTLSRFRLLGDPFATLPRRR